MNTGRQIIKHAFPLTLAASLSVLIGITDAIYIVRYSVDAFKALTLIIPIQGMAGAVGIAIGTGLVDSIRKHHELEKHKIFVPAFRLILLSLIIIFILSSTMGDSFAQFNKLNLASNKSILNYYTKYWYAIIPSYMALLILNVLVQYLSYKNQHFELTKVLFLIFTINLILNPILIFFLKLGVLGAALASFISLFIGILFLMLKVKRLTKVFRLLIKKAKNISWLNDIFLDQFKVASYVFLSMVVFIIGGIFFNQLALEQGHEFLALYGVIEQLKVLVIFPNRGISGAYLIVFVKHLLGKRVEDYWKIFWNTSALSLLVTLCGALFYFLGLDLIFYLFKIKEYSHNLFTSLLLSLIIYLFVGIIPKVSGVGFIPLGKSYLLFLHSLSTVVAGYIITVYILKLGGLYWFFVGQIVAMLGISIIFILIFRRTLNKRIGVDLELRNELSIEA